MNLYEDTIAAIATAPGAGAIAVIRLSGQDSIDLVSDHFHAASQKKLADQPSHSIHLGELVFEGKVIDQVLVSIFKGHRSYTGEPVAEISCHGSHFIQQQLLQHLLKTGRCRLAEAGEFTKRAFLNQKMSLSEAEAVADLIAAESEASHQIALAQMRGGFSTELTQLREQLIHMASMIELELDFSGEDVSFASREELSRLLQQLKSFVKALLDSFAYGNAVKQGVAIALIGAPNAGKSTLLNALLNEERAIVSDIAGTTRDTVEDEIVIEGILFRLIDTAGIRETSDAIEKVGIERSLQSAQKASIVVLLVDSQTFAPDDLNYLEALLQQHQIAKEQCLLVFNKTDLITPKLPEQTSFEVLQLSAKDPKSLESLKQALVGRIHSGQALNTQGVLTNARHYQSFTRALEEIAEVEDGLSKQIPSDLLAISLRQVIHHLGEITGAVSTDDLLGSIFSNFCIGK